MFKTLKTCFFTLTFFLVIFSNSVFAHDELWNKAVNNFEKSKLYSAKNVIFYMYELNKDGSTKSIQEIQQKLKNSKKNDYYILKATKDGKDNTEEMIEQRKSRKNKQRGFNSSEYSIFSKEVQKNVTYNKIGSEKINNSTYSLYNFIYNKSEKENFEGKTWIKEDNGIPLKMELTMNPLPIMVKKMEMSFNFRTDNDKYYLDKMSGEVVASMVLFEKRYKIISEFKDYVKL